MEVTGAKTHSSKSLGLSNLLKYGPISFTQPFFLLELNNDVVGITIEDPKHTFITLALLTY